MGRGNEIFFRNTSKETLFFWFCGVILLSWLFKSVVVSFYELPTTSMSPTIDAGSYIMVSKYPYRIRAPLYWPLAKIEFPFFLLEGSEKSTEVIS